MAHIPNQALPFLMSATSTYGRIDDSLAIGLIVYSMSSRYVVMSVCGAIFAACKQNLTGVIEIHKLHGDVGR